MKRKILSLLEAHRIMPITGLSMAARAHRVSDRAEAEKVIGMLPLKYPGRAALDRANEDARFAKRVAGSYPAAR